MTNQNKAIVAALIGNIIFGFSFLASKVALSLSEPLIMLAVRFVISWLLLNLLLLSGREQLQLHGKPVFSLLLLGFCQPVAYFLCESKGIQHASTSFTGIMIGLVPILGFFVGIIFQKESFSAKKLIFSLGSVLGVICISLAERSEGTTTISGILYLAGAVGAATVFSLFSRRTARYFSAFERTYIIFFVGCMTFSVLSIAKYPGTLWKNISGLLGSATGLIAILYLAVFSSVIAFYCINYAFGLLPVQQSTSFSNLTSVVSVLAGVLLLSEAFTPLHIAGVLLIVFCVYCFNREAPEEKKTAPEPTATATVTESDTGACAGNGAVRHLFLTGEKGVGKSTLLRRHLAGKTVRGGGFRTVKAFDVLPGRTTLHILSKTTGLSPSSENYLFTCGEPETYSPAAFDRLGVFALQDAEDADYLVMDELGPHETEAAAFCSRVRELLDGPLPVYGVLQRADSEFLQEIAVREDVRLMEVTRENRNNLLSNEK